MSNKLDSRGLFDEMTVAGTFQSTLYGREKSYFLFWYCKVFFM